jgi:hypothetical protein
VVTVVKQGWGDCGPDSLNFDGEYHRSSTNVTPRRLPERLRGCPGHREQQPRLQRRRESDDP